MSCKQYTFKTTKSTEWLEDILDHSDERSQLIRDILIDGLRYRGVVLEPPVQQPQYSIQNRRSDTPKMSDTQRTDKGQTSDTQRTDKGQTSDTPKMSDTQNKCPTLIPVEEDDVNIEDAENILKTLYK